MDLLIIVALAIVLDIAAFKWGFDSKDGINSPEWEKRLQRGHAI